MVLKSSPWVLNIIILLLLFLQKHQWTLLVIDKGFQHTKLCLIWVYMQKL